MIEIELARELVAPDSLEDVLTTLVTAGAIQNFAFGRNFVKIDTNPNKRIDLAFLIEETTKFRYQNRTSVKKH